MKYLRHNFIFITTFTVSILYVIYFVTYVKKPINDLTKQDTALQISPELYRLLGAGHTRLMTSILWINTLIESDYNHHIGDTYTSWLYNRFLVISKLEPKFKFNYIFGGIYLSVVKDNPHAGTDILLRGHKIFPNNYRILYQLATNEYTEFGNPTLALKYYQKLHALPESKEAFKLLPSIIAKLKSRNKDLELSFDIYHQLFNSEQEPALKEIHLKRLYAIKSEIDLTCLNSNISKVCKEKDLNGDDYIKDIRGKFTTIKPFKKFRIKKAPLKKGLR